MTQTEFAQKLNISPSMVSKICSGAAEPSVRTTNDISEKFGIDIVWLQAGIGNKYNRASDDELLAAFFGQVLSGRQPPIYWRFFRAISCLTPEELESLETFAELLIRIKETPRDDNPEDKQKPPQD